MAEISDVQGQFDIALDVLNTSCAVALEVQDHHENGIGAAESTVVWVEGSPTTKGALQGTRGALDRVKYVQNVGQEAEGKLVDIIKAVEAGLSGSLGALAVADEGLGQGVSLTAEATRIIRLAKYSYDDLRADGEVAATKAQNSEGMAKQVVALLESIGASTPAAQEAVECSTRLQEHSKVYHQDIITGGVVEALRDTGPGRFDTVERSGMETVLRLGSAKGNLHSASEKITQAYALLQEALSDVRTSNSHLQGSVDALSGNEQEMIAMTSDVKATASILRDNQGAPDAMVENAGAARTKVEEVRANM